MVDEALAVGVDEDGDEVLHVPHLVDGAQPDLLERIEGDAPRGGAGVEFHDEIFGFRLAPGGGQVPKLGLLVVDDDAIGPG